MYTELVASEFVSILSDPRFQILRTEQYRNRSGRSGMRWEGEVHGRYVFVSESRTKNATPPRTLAEIILKTETRLDPTKDALYFARKRCGTGMRIEFNYHSRWYG